MSDRRNAMMRLTIVDSGMEPGNLSVRMFNGHHLSAGAFKRGLRVAGFEAGQRAVLVDAEYWDKLQELVEEMLRGSEGKGGGR